MNARRAWLTRVPGLAAIVAIAVLSLVPVELRPHVGPKLLEHFGAYLGTGLLLALAYPQLCAIIAPGLAVYSAALEIAQTWIPGRTASIADFAVSSLGACVGVVLVWAAHRVLFRPAAGASSGSERG
jgi:hypothetical protein